MISKPSWLTPEHLLITLAIAFLVIIVGMSWVVMVTRRNSALRYLIHERELDQKELQKAHDTLESRVKERTEQLKFQITAKKVAEVQFKATLTERTRLAKDLHDTIEQTMTGLTLQLNTVRKLFQVDPKTTAHRLELIRNMVRMCRVDLKRSIWDLRIRELGVVRFYIGGISQCQPDCRQCRHPRRSRNERSGSPAAGIHRRNLAEDRAGSRYQYRQTFRSHLRKN